MSFKEYSFQDLLSNIVDNRGKTCPVTDSGIPLIATNCIKNDSLFPVYEKIRFVDDETYQNWFRGHPEPEDIIFVCKGSPGQVAWTQSPVPFCIAQDMVSIRANLDLILPKYLFALLRSPKTQKKIEDMHVGSLIPHFKKGDFKNLYLDIIEDKVIQKKVGDIYFSFCEKIEANRQINQTLEEMAQAIFKSWFIDFEPVKAKIQALENGGTEEDANLAAMVTISGKTTQQLQTLKTQSPNEYQQLYQTAQLFPSAMEESELGEIPLGWEVQTLEDVLTLNYGKALKKTDRIEGEFPVYGSGGVTGSHKKPLVNGPGIIVGRKGSVGKLYWEEKDFFPIDTVFYVSGKRYSLEFLFRLLETLGLENMNTDAAVPGLNRNNVYRLLVPSFPDLLVEQYQTTLHTFQAIISNKSEEISLLIKIRDSLLPKLLLGQIEPQGNL